MHIPKTFQQNDPDNLRGIIRQHYPAKQEHGKAVPTWNYITVHVRGEISFVHDKKWNLKMITDLTDQHESVSASTCSVSDAPEGYIDKYAVSDCRD